jgi:hypothetical protein
MGRLQTWCCKSQRNVGSAEFGRHDRVDYRR